MDQQQKPKRLITLHLYSNDIELAKLKGINISGALREYLHHLVNEEVGKDKTTQDAAAKLEEMQKAKATTEAEIRAQEQILARLREQEIEEAAKLVADQEAKDKEKSMCCMCGGPLGRHYQLVKTGPFKGRMLCGDLTTGCVKKVYDENITEWRTWLT